MKKIVLLFILPILIGLSNVSADETNYAPVAVNDTAITNEDTSVEINLISNDTDVNLDTLVVTGISSIFNGTGVIKASGTGVIFTPNLNFHGTGSFDYTVSDGFLSDTGSVTITVNSINDMPNAVDDVASTNENTSIAINLVSNDIDVDGDILTVTTLGTILNGTGVINSSKTGIVFTPNTGFKGIVNIMYTVSDGNFSDVGNVLISVHNENEEDNNEDKDNGNKFKEKHVVQAVQKEFISKFNALKKEYKKSMGKSESRNEYLRLKEELRKEYLLKLKEVTGQAKKYSYDGDYIKISYKNTYKNKYGSMLSLYTDTKLESIIIKIDDMIAEVNISNRSDVTKARLNTMLLALRELLLDYMDNDEDILDIDSLFE